MTEVKTLGDSFEFLNRQINRFEKLAQVSCCIQIDQNRVKICGNSKVLFESRLDAYSPSNTTHFMLGSMYAHIMDVANKIRAKCMLED